MPALQVCSLECAEREETQMKARQVVGRRIVAIEQERVWNPRRCAWIYHVAAIVLDNGAVLVTGVEELDADYAVELRYLPAKPREKR
jgi:fibrillarin-like rRNA methylase